MARRVVVLALALLAAGLAAPGPAAAQAGELHPPVELARGWEFALAPEGPWKPVTVPHVFEGRPVEERFDGTIGWYRLRFEGPRTRPGMAWWLQFEGVRRRAEVFLNGRTLGSSGDPYTPFRMPADGIRAGRENLLTVRVDNRRTPGLREGWWNWGGITRAVRLEPRGPAVLRGTAVLGDVDCRGTCRASVVVDGWVDNTTTGPVRPELALRLRPRGGGPLTARAVRLRTIAPGESARVRVTVPVAGEPRLWAPENPRLYDGAIELRVGGELVDRQTDAVGLRTVRVRDGALELNGRRLQLRGASIQEDMPGRGPALTDADVEAFVRELQALGANVTRAHYLLDERLLDRLDEEGILVWSQAPIYHRDVQLRTAEGRERELGSLRRTVLEARRHPAVLTHSVANELSPAPDANPTTRRFLDEARAMVAELDPTVPPSVDVLAWPGFPAQRTYAAYPLLGMNSYFGWYDGDPQHDTSRLSDLEPFLKGFHTLYPRNALVMTEFGAEATMPGPADVKETFAFQARYLRSALGVIERLPFMQGAIYWTLREFAVKPDWDGGAQRTGVERDGIHDKGLLEYRDGARKPAWSVAERAFSRTPLYTAPASWPVAAAVDARPEAEPAGALTVAVAAILLTAVLALGVLLARLGRDVLRDSRGPRRPGSGALPDELAERRRLRRAA